MRQVGSFGVSRGEAGYYPPFDRDGDGDIDSGDLQEVARGWRAARQMARLAYAAWSGAVGKHRRTMLRVNP